MNCDSRAQHWALALTLRSKRKKEMITEDSHVAKLCQCSSGFSLNFNSNPVKWLLLCLFYRWRNKGSDGCNDFLVFGNQALIYWKLLSCIAPPCHVPKGQIFNLSGPDCLQLLNGTWHFLFLWVHLTLIFWILNAFEFSTFLSKSFESYCEWHALARVWLSPFHCKRG